MNKNTIPIASQFPAINHLYQELGSVSTGRSNLVSFIGQPAMSHAFFPGGNGLINGEKTAKLPLGGTLILGSNFGAKEKYSDAQGNLLCKANETNNGGTWRGLRERFTCSQLENAFFTNAWPFLHLSSTSKKTEPPNQVKNKPSNLGEPKKWLDDVELRNSCLGFFCQTLNEFRPTLIVALGIAPAAFLSYLFPETLKPWRECSVPAIDSLPLAISSFSERSLVCVAITHPSQAKLNAQRRAEPYTGQAGEERLLAEAFEKVSQL